MLRIQIQIFLLFSVLCCYAITGVSAETNIDSKQEISEPEVTIIKQEDQTIEEYRVKGQLYMVKVIPRKGVAYYLIDTNGDGRLDTRQHELDEGVQIPQWILFQWK